jgi:pseudaminic acid biosynthesis-associated methylase
MTNFHTEQEKFWAGQFGDDYTLRNRGADWIASNLAFFSRVLQRTENVRSVIEFGANIGMNLQAIRLLLPAAKLAAVEINEKAVAELRGLTGLQIHHQSLLEFAGGERHDLCLIKGVMIHLNPEKLPQVYDTLHRSSARYICLAEYYNPTPVSVPYRGHSDRLFKRDFAGEMLDRFPDLQLLDYGFVYRRDPNFPQDDLTWFLLEKDSRR